jgi:hypothetical protein
MPKDPDPRPIICPLTSAGFHADAGPGMESPMWAEADDLHIDLCGADQDASREGAPSLGDCNLDCCHCAIRWYARRIVNLREN